MQLVAESGDHENIWKSFSSWSQPSESRTSEVNNREQAGWGQVGGAEERVAGVKREDFKMVV